MVEAGILLTHVNPLFCTCLLIFKNNIQVKILLIRVEFIYIMMVQFRQNWINRDRPCFQKFKFYMNFFCYCLIGFFKRELSARIDVIWYVRNSLVFLIFFPGGGNSEL